jgi:sugar phosphate isomerase/epimerase
MTNRRRLTLGASVFYDPELPCIDFCRYVINHGIEWIEVKLEPVFYYSDVDENDVAEYLSGLAQTVPVSIHAFHLELNAGSMNPDVRQASLKGLRRSVDFASKIGPGTIVTLHPGDNGEAPPSKYHEVRHNTITIFKEVVDHARNLEVNISLENRGREGQGVYKYARTVEEISALRRELGCDIKYTVDVGHLTFLGEDPSCYVQELGPENVALAHIHNNDGTYDSHSATPSGLIDYEAFLETYYEKNWRFPLVVEVKRMDYLIESIDHLSRCRQAMTRQRDLGSGKSVSC